jgi:hypothetical protein
MLVSAALFAGACLVAYLLVVAALLAWIAAGVPD